MGNYDSFIENYETEQMGIIQMAITLINNKNTKSMVVLFNLRFGHMYMEINIILNFKSSEECLIFNTNLRRYFFVGQSV